MIRYLLAASILMTFVTLPLHGQGTMVVLLDVYQNPSEKNTDLTEQMVGRTQQLVTAHEGEVFTHFCDPFNSDYHAIGREGVAQQLDSIISGKIPPPQLQANWQQMGLDVIERLIQKEEQLGLETAQIHLITASSNSKDFESNLVKPLAHVFNFFDATGAFSEDFKVTIHSYSSGQSSPTITQITSLK